MPLDHGRMQQFAARLLTEGGALAEPIEPEGLEVLAPPSVQTALGVGEFSRFGFGPSLPTGAQRVGIESDWLGRFGHVVGERGRWSRQVLEAGPRKAPDAERLLAQELVLDNATFRLLGAAPAWTRYLVMDFRYTAVSDEKREGTQLLMLNLATGAMPDAMAGDTANWPGEPNGGAMSTDAAVPPDWERALVMERVRQALPWRVEAALAAFLTGLRRRLARDLDRLHAYHNDLHREASLRAAQLNASDAARQREAARIAAIGQEYRAKLDDLAHKYAVRVNADWVQTMELVVPVHRFTVQIRRRKGVRDLTLDWNTRTRRLEPPPCEATWSRERPRLVCDDALHLVSPAGLAPCDGCGRAYCRACHTQACPEMRPHRPRCSLR